MGFLLASDSEVASIASRSDCPSLSVSTSSSAVCLSLVPPRHAPPSSSPQVCSGWFDKHGNLKEASEISCPLFLPKDSEDHPYCLLARDAYPGTV